METYPTSSCAIGPEATGRNEAMRFRYRHWHSLSGATDFSWVLPPKILFPDAERITNKKALCKQSMLQQKELQVELRSTTSSIGWGFRATAQSLPLLWGSSSGRVHILKTTEIARLAVDLYLIYSRGIYYFTDVFQLSNYFILGQGTFKALSDITSLNINDTHFNGPAFSLGTQNSDSCQCWSEQVHIKCAAVHTRLIFSIMPPRISSLVMISLVPWSLWVLVS